MAWTGIGSTDTDAKSPLDASLLDLVRTNDADHETRILSLEGGGGGGGGGGSAEGDPRYVTKSNIRTNEAKFERARYHIGVNYKNNPVGVLGTLGFDAENSNDSLLSIGLFNNLDIAVPPAIDNTLAYRGEYFDFEKNDGFQFTTKIGVTGFGIGAIARTTGADSVTITVDGDSVTTASLTDETTTARSDTYTTNQAVTKYQIVQWFMGLDPSRVHTIKVENTDSVSKKFACEFIELLSITTDYTIDRTIDVSAGRVTVRGTDVNVSETTKSFAAPTGSGGTAALAVDTSGVVTILEALEPARTKALPEATISFSSAVTTIDVVNVEAFPAQGFLLGQHPLNKKSIASYGSKTGDLRGSFDDMQFSGHQSDDDFVPESNFTSATQGAATGDYTFELWAGEPASGGNVTTANDDINFRVTLRGSDTLHAATVATGLYSSDLVPLGGAIVKAMEAAKSLDGFDAQYFCNYDEDLHRWSIGITGQDATEFQLLNNSGAGAASNVLKSLCGFSDTDLTTSNVRSYQGQNEVESKAIRVFETNDDRMMGVDPRVKHQNVSEYPLPAQMQKLEEDYGLGGMHWQSFAGGAPNRSFIRLFPEPEATAVLVSFASHEQSNPFLLLSVDNGEAIYATPMKGLHSVGDSSSGSNIVTYFMSFPQGSKVISLMFLDRVQFHLLGIGPQVGFIGAKPYFSKPQIEALTTSQAILKPLQISPKEIYQTDYKMNYTPIASNDNIDTVNFTGSWTLDAANTLNFNGLTNSTTTINDTCDITFTLAGDGGGIAIRMYWENIATELASFYLVTGATPSETSSLIQNHNTFWSNHQNHWPFEQLGLPAGQYTLRIKNRQAAQMHILGIKIMDTVPPQANEATVIGDVTNTGQGMTFGYSTIAHGVQADAEDRVPVKLTESFYKENVALVDTGFFNKANAANYDLSVQVRQQLYHYANHYVMAALNDYARTFAFCKSMYIEGALEAGSSSTDTATIDGVDASGNVNLLLATKGGGAPTNRQQQCVAHKRFFTYGTAVMSSSTVFVVGKTDGTLGFKAGHKAILRANSQPDVKVIIASISTDTSITFEEAVANHTNYTLAAEVSLANPGFHSMKMTASATAQSNIASFRYTPLDIVESKHNERRLSRAKNKKGEVATLKFTAVANNGDLAFPVYSDGRVATYSECSFSITARSASTASVTDIPGDLQDIQVSTGNVDIVIKATRRF